MLKRELYLNRLRPIYHNDIIKFWLGYEDVENRRFYYRS